jgi:hypothetical protein
MCPLSIYCVLSTLLAGGARATLQTVHMSSPLSKQCARAARCTVLIIPCTRSFPCTPILRRSRMSGHEKIALASNISSSKYYIRYVTGPTCRGLVPLYMPPFSYKRGAMQRYNTGSILGSDSQLSSFHSNPTYSGVGCYAPAARITLNSRMFMCLMFA